jgi:hypothetical protein
MLHIAAREHLPTSIPPSRTGNINRGLTFHSVPANRYEELFYNDVVCSVYDQVLAELTHGAAPSLNCTVGYHPKKPHPHQGWMAADGLGAHPPPAPPPISNYTCDWNF